jgi:hypothetical protein
MRSRRGDSLLVLAALVAAMSTVAGERGASGRSPRPATKSATARELVNLTPPTSQVRRTTPRQPLEAHRPTLVRWNFFPSGRRGRWRWISLSGKRSRRSTGSVGPVSPDVSSGLAGGEVGDGGRLRGG